MSSSDWSYAARTRKRTRERLFTPAAIAAFAAMTLGVLIAIFPHRTLVRQLSSTAGHDLLTVTYGKALLKTDPDDAGLRIALLHTMIEGGYLRSARDLLRPLYAHADQSVRDQARLLELDIYEKEVYAEKPDSPERARAVKAAHERLAQILDEPWSPQTLAKFAEKALALEDAPLAIAMYERAGAQRSARAPLRLAQAGQIALSIGEYQRAAAAYFAAQSEAVTTEARREYFLAAVRSLQSGNLPGDAYAEAIKRGEEFGNDREVAAYLETLRRQAGTSAASHSGGEVERQAAQPVARTSSAARRATHRTALSKPAVLKTYSAKRAAAVRAQAPTVKREPTHAKGSQRLLSSRRRNRHAALPVRHSTRAVASTRAVTAPTVVVPKVLEFTVPIAVPLASPEAARAQAINLDDSRSPSAPPIRVPEVVPFFAPIAVEPERREGGALPEGAGRDRPRDGEDVSQASAVPPSEDRGRKTWWAMLGPGTSVDRQWLAANDAEPGVRITPLPSTAELLDAFRRMEQEVYAADEGSPARREGLERLNRRLAEMLDAPWTETELKFLADKAIAQGNPSLAIEIFDRMALQGGEAAHGWHAQAARLALGGGDYRGAAQRYFTAQSEAPTRELAREHFISGLKTLQSGNLLPEAWSAALEGGRALREDPLALRAVVEIAQAAGKTREAEPFFERLAELEPEGALDWYAKAAQFASWRADHRGAARLRFLAQSVAPERAQQREQFWAGVTALQAGNLVLEAWSEGQAHLGALIDDVATLQNMIRLARAADKTAAAEGYVDRLLALADPKWQAPKADADMQSELPRLAPEMAAFDADLYLLAFQVYAGSGKLEKALTLAYAASLQRPQDLEWRARYAQVAEWAGKPSLALGQWMRLHQTNGDQQALQAVQRLAIATNDDEAAVWAWQAIARERDLTDEELVKFILIAERAGEADRALETLDVLERRNARKIHATSRASLLERLGRDQAAAAEYQRIVDMYGVDTEVARKQFLALSALGRAEQAYQVLRAAQPLAEEGDRVYWHALAKAAWSLRDEDTALTAYRQLSRTLPHEAETFDRLVQLLEVRDPIEAAALAQDEWRRSGRATHFMTALSLRVQAMRWQAVKGSLAELSPEQTAAFEGNRAFLMLRGQYHQQAGHPQAALQDLERALSLEPSSLDARLALLWLTIDQRMQAKLRTYLIEWAPLAASSDAVRGAFAAGYFALGEPRRALPHYLAFLKRQPNSYLWLLNYADALEQTGSPELALRVRYQAWAVVRPSLEKLTPHTPASRRALFDYARSVLRQAPGDPAHDVIALLLKDAAEMSGAEQAVVNELALAWAFSNESHDLARAWLWTRYAHDMRAPLYAQVALALQSGDRDKLKQLLTDRERALGDFDKIEAAKTLGYTALASEYAFDALSRNPHDDNLHAQVVDTTLPLATSVTASSDWTRQGAVSFQDYSLAYSQPTPHNTRMSVIGLTRRQSARNDSVIKNLPAGEKELELKLEANRDGGQTTVRLGRRNAVGDMTLASVSHRFDLTQGVSLTPRLGRNQAAEESIGLKVAGAKDVAGLAWVFV